MQLLRLLVLVLLSLALPTVGLASAGFMGECQMAVAGTGMTAMATSAEHCDMEQAKASQPDSFKAGKACKLGQDCKIGTTYHPADSIEQFQPLPLARWISPLPSEAMLSHIPDGVWRPPAAL
ncbi:MAG: hypothetical protein JSR49_07040 [Proteobacteria bacterium]|nr:hypothetical protein [Pseudomonadota bacterium]